MNGNGELFQAYVSLCVIFVPYIRSSTISLYENSCSNGGLVERDLVERDCFL